MALNVAAVAAKQIKNARTGEMVSVDSLWKDQTSVVVFFRRWGCLFCRIWAQELSKLAPVLKDNGMRLVGVGVDEVGLEDFEQGKFFSGDLFIDSNKSVYSGLKFKRYNWVTILLALLSGEARAAVAKGRQAQIQYDFKGDGLQNGGALVVKKGGEILFSFYQDRPAEHVSNEKFAEILGIKYSAPEGDTKEEKPTVCD